MKLNAYLMQAEFISTDLALRLVKMQELDWEMVSRDSQGPGWWLADQRKQI